MRDDDQDKHESVRTDVLRVFGVDIDDDNFSGDYPVRPKCRGA